MNEMYIRIYEDDRLHPSHISIYFSLFQYWNLNRFQNPFSVARFEIMKLAKIKSPNTYSKCVKELMSWGYLKYEPSHNPYQGSRFSLVNFCASAYAKNGRPLIQGYAKNAQPLSSTYAKNGRALIPSKTYKLKSINERENSLTQDLIIEYFISQKSNRKEAQKFWNHYESNGWLIGGKTPMIDWQASVRNWILRSKEINVKQVVQKMDHLHITTKKNYNESL